MSPERPGQGARTDRFPRVSGDEPLRDLCAYVLQRFSPRERG